MPPPHVPRSRVLSRRTGPRLRQAIAALATTVLFAATFLPGPAAAAGAPVPALHWRSCDDGFQCATARVPLDHRHPSGTMIDLAVVRHPATDGTHRLGALFVNGGGPSEQIAPLRDQFASVPAEWRARYDIVSFDPRGFGASTAIRCFPTMEAESRFLSALPIIPTTAAQIATWDRTWARFDARCARQNAPLLRHDSTADVARDMDLLRQAVGAPTLNYVGLSYGTGLGAVYANLFPTRVGRMVLDGNLDPVAWTHGDGRLPAFLRMGTDQASAATQKSFLDLCGKTPTCAFSAGTPSATQAKFKTLLSRLHKRPVPIGTPPDTLSCDDLCAVLSLPLAEVSAWKEAAEQLQQLWTASPTAQATTPQDLIQPSPIPTFEPRSTARATPPQSLTRPTASRPTARAATPQSRIQPSTPPTPESPPTSQPTAYAGQEQSYAVRCSDSANPRNPRAYTEAAELASARSGLIGPSWVWPDEPCANWPASEDAYTGPWNRRTANPVLLIGNTGDPATSYENSIAMSHALSRARLLTVHGYGHTEFSNPSHCADEYRDRYLLTGTLPPAGTVCEQDTAPFT
ncbi:alpha/beta hydrolase [Actinomadura sp. DC4]|uniref:alpha/beta hydrolase n=1 Tax=Actinomadura sp. DC4 TaxID=3055069 RepID=UPI0025B12762|nr:alpha/beta hydrolase [Actinomadura sp. DC4]MDN3359977.1 alpha/beta hydrolase [Actinomadura sp. DC4]